MTIQTPSPTHSSTSVTSSRSIPNGLDGQRSSPSLESTSSSRTSPEVSLPAALATITINNGEPTPPSATQIPIVIDANAGEHVDNGETERTLKTVQPQQATGAGIEAKPHSATAGSSSPNNAPSASASGTSPASVPATSLTKPKSTRGPRRSPSPATPPPPAPPPPQTIRLDVRLGGPINYEVNVAQLARETGQRPSTPQPGKHGESSDSEEDDEKAKEDEKEKTKDEPPKEGVKKRRRRGEAEYYDLNDPFIDDSELAIDERKFFAQTKQQGFYVSSGEVALLKDKPVKKKSKRALLAAGTQATPINLTTSDTENPSTSANSPNLTSGVKRKLPTKAEMDVLTAPTLNSNSSTSALKKRKLSSPTDVTGFSPALQHALVGLKEEIAKESFAQKGKFPPQLRPVLQACAIVAIENGDYDDRFFSFLPTCFPYNKFTMSKLVKRLVFQEHIAFLTKQSDEVLAELTAQVTDGFEKAQEEWAKSVFQWQKRQEKAKTEGASSTSTSAPASTVGNNNAMVVDGESGASAAEDNHANQANNTSANDATVVNAANGTTSHPTSRDAQPPQKRYRLTDTMKALVWKLVSISNEMCKLENEKNTFDGSTVQVSEQGLRKQLYQKILACFPKEWMTSGQISREVSTMKKKFEKEAADEEES